MDARSSARVLAVAGLFAFAAILRGIAATVGTPTPKADAPEKLSPAMPGTSVNLTSAQSSGMLNPSLRNETSAAVNRALDWLAAQQKEDGSWSNGGFPALTGLPLWAFAESGNPKWKDTMDKAVRYILSCVQTNGGIYRDLPGKEGGLSSYNTAICMIALNAVGDPALAPYVQRARTFMAGSQHLGDDVYYGGMGYDKATGKPYADLSNAVLGYEAMRLTENVEDLRPKAESHADLNWEAARKFLDRVQQKTDAGSNEAGGFIYRPGESKAGATTNREGAVVFRSYGSMTYAGLLSLIYAEVPKDDPRAKSAFDWASRHWSLDENPGAGSDGLYYFYNVLTKSLAAFGRNSLALGDGTAIDWRSELVKKLLSLQKIDPKTGHGYWLNSNGRWWEADPVLVTCYSALALEIAAGKQIQP